LITTILKPGKRANGKIIPLCGIIKRLIKHIRSHWPHTIIIFRGDSHFTYPEIMEWIDGQENVYFCTGLTANLRLEALVQSHIERAKKLYNLHKDKISLYHY
jgi:hypothetical protein